MNSRPLPRRRGGALRKLGWLSAIAMLAVSAFAPATTYAGVANNVNSIYFPDMHRWRHDRHARRDRRRRALRVRHLGHRPLPGEGLWVEIPGSRVTLSIDSSDSAYPFGPLDVSQHRDGVNSYRVETDGGSAKSASIHPCGARRRRPPQPPRPRRRPPRRRRPRRRPPRRRPRRRRHADAHADIAGRPNANSNAHSDP